MNPKNNDIIAKMFYILIILSVTATAVTVIPLAVWLRLSQVNTLEDLQGELIYAIIILTSVLIGALILRTVYLIAVKRINPIHERDEKSKHELPQLIIAIIPIPILTTVMILISGEPTITKSNTVIKVKSFLLQHFGTIWLISGLSTLAIVIYIREIRPKRKGVK